MNRENYTRTVIVEGKELPYDPVNQKVLVPCRECGTQVEAGAQCSEDEVTRYMGYSCPKCGYWYSLD